MRVTVTYLETNDTIEVEVDPNKSVHDALRYKIPIPDHIKTLLDEKNIEYDEKELLEELKYEDDDVQEAINEVPTGIYFEPKTNRRLVGEIPIGKYADSHLTYADSHLIVTRTDEILEQHVALKFIRPKLGGFIRPKLGFILEEHLSTNWNDGQDVLKYSKRYPPWLDASMYDEEDAIKTRQLQQIPTNNIARRVILIQKSNVSNDTKWNKLKKLFDNLIKAGRSFHDLKAFFRVNQSFYQRAVQLKGEWIRYYPKKKQLSYAIDAVKNNARAYIYLPTEAKRSPGVCEKVFANNQTFDPNVVPSDVRDNPKFANFCQEHDNVRYVSERFRDNRDWMQYAVANRSPNAALYATPRLLRDVEFVVEVLKQRGKPIRPLPRILEIANSIVFQRVRRMLAQRILRYCIDTWKSSISRDREQHS